MRTDIGSEQVIAAARGMSRRFAGSSSRGSNEATCARHSLALEHTIRPLFSYLRALTTPTGVFAASEDWGADSTIDGGLAARLDRAAAEFATLVTHHEHAATVDPSTDIIPLEQLLNAR